MKTLTTSIFAIALLITATAAFAQKNQAIDHRIVMVKDLLQNAEEAEWKDQFNNRILLQENRVANTGVQRNVIEGVSYLAALPRLGSPLIALPESQRAKLFQQYNSGARVKHPVIDVKFGNQDQAIRGVYQLTLPQELKHIQLEVNYDVILNGFQEDSTTQFMVEVNERSISNPDVWVNTRILKNYKIEPAVSRSEKILNPVFELNGQFYQSHLYNAVLSEWRGKEVQVVLTALPGSGNTRSNGRWTNARLVGSTFGIALGEFEKASPNRSAR